MGNLGELHMSTKYVYFTIIVGYCYMIGTHPFKQLQDIVLSVYHIVCICTLHYGLLDIVMYDVMYNVMVTCVIMSDFVRSYMALRALIS